MISKITVTPTASFAVKNSFNFYQNRNNSVANVNSGLDKDTVSFTGKKNQRIISKVVDKAFKKLSTYQLKTKNNLKMFGTKSGEVNVLIQENVLGKEARLTLSNGDFKGGSFLNFDLKRSTGEKSKITPVDSDMSASEAAKLIKRYLK